MYCLFIYVIKTINTFFNDSLKYSKKNKKDKKLSIKLFYCLLYNKYSLFKDKTNYIY